MVNDPSGTVTLPPVGCDYLAGAQVFEIVNGLPPGTTIELAPIHKDFICNEQALCGHIWPPRKEKLNEIRRVWR